MKVAMHNWMRAEPVETTIRRLAKFGYDGIEISYDSVALGDNAPGTAAVRQSLKDNGIECVGSISLMFAGRDLIHADPAVRADSVDYLKGAITMIKELRAGADRPGHHEHRPLRGRQGEGDGLARGGVGLGGRGPQGGQRAREVGGRADRDRGAQPLRDELRQPPRPGAPARAGGRRRRRRLPRRLPHEPGGVRPAAGVPQRRPTACSTCTWPTTTAWPSARASCPWADIIGTLKDIGYDGSLTVEFVAPLDRTPANPYKNAMAAADESLTRRAAEVHRGPRLRRALRGVLLVAGRGVGQDAPREHVSARRRAAMRRARILEHIRAARRGDDRRARARPCHLEHDRAPRPRAARARGPGRARPRRGARARSGARAPPDRVGPRGSRRSPRPRRRSPSTRSRA